jgi:magnesium chelatase family protein
MLAARLPGLLPELPMAAALELTAVHSVAGLLPASTPLVRRPPFRSPHHTATVAALVGGGSGLLRPGEVSLAHHGILLLDEAPEFSSAALDALRQPLESGRVELARAGLAATFPACCQLVLTANPCPCAQPAESCSCGPTVKRRYLGRLSGPLLDRIDLQITVLPVSRAAMAASSIPESSAVVAERVAQARQAAAARYAGTPWRLNRDVPGVELRRRWPVATTAQRQLLPHLDAGSLTLRGYDRVVRTAWTLADLNGRTVPERAEIAEALSLRGVPTAYARRGGHDAA